MNKKIVGFLFGFFIFPSSVLAVNPGESAPACISTNFHNGQVLDIVSYKGKVVYMDFWASWCPPCKLSFPSLNQLHNELKDEGFEVVAINLDEEKSDAEVFLKHNPVDFSIAYDGEGKCPGAYQVKAMPSSYIIDKQGIVREVHLGFDEDKFKKIRTSILALLKE